MWKLLSKIPWTDKEDWCLWQKFKKFYVLIETAIWQRNSDLRSLGKYHVVSPWCFFHPGVSPLFTLVLHAKQVIGLEAELCTIPLHRPAIKQHLVLPDVMESFAVGLLNLFYLIDCNLISIWNHFKLIIMLTWIEFHVKFVCYCTFLYHFALFCYFTYFYTLFLFRKLLMFLVMGYFWNVKIYK